MTRTRKCAPDKHKDRALKGGKRVECVVCKDQFPCLLMCDHHDCVWVRSGEVSLLDYVKLASPVERIDTCTDDVILPLPSF